MRIAGGVIAVRRAEMNGLPRASRTAAPIYAAEYVRRRGRSVIKGQRMKVRIEWVIF